MIAAAKFTMLMNIRVVVLAWVCTKKGVNEAKKAFALALGASTSQLVNWCDTAQQLLHDGNLIRPLQSESGSITTTESRRTLAIQRKDLGLRALCVSFPMGMRLCKRVAAAGAAAT